MMLASDLPATDLDDAAVKLLGALLAVAGYSVHDSPCCCDPKKEFLPHPSMQD
jgi:hypothetical protein